MAANVCTDPGRMWGNAAPQQTEKEPILRLRPVELLGGAQSLSATAPFAGAVWYEAGAVGGGLRYSFPGGALAQARFLTADMLLDGIHLAVFRLQLREGDQGPLFTLTYGLLNQCSARLRLAMEAVNQNRWMYAREGAWLKPLIGGQRVDLTKVDRLTITLAKKSDRPVRWCLTDILAVTEEPYLLKDPYLPKGPLLDELGQSTLHHWPTKSRSAEEVSERIRTQLADTSRQHWPNGFTRWGGWKKRRFQRTGFFHTHHDGHRWWLVDPQGYAFWSAGMDCVRVDTEANYTGLEKALAWMPERSGRFAAAYGDNRNSQRTGINFLAANFIRALGPGTWREGWAKIALSQLRRLGFNTVANWSDWQIARQAGFPYVRPLNLRFRNSTTIYRDFPDIYHPGFALDVEELAGQLRETRTDPSFIGYFLMNEPNWGFSSEPPGAGMLFTSPKCETRKVLTEFLLKRYGSEQALADAWAIPVTLAAIAEGPWKTPLPAKAKSDLADFSAIMVEKFFKDLCQACRRIDPHHLNLGIRYHTIPPSWALEGMRCFDVFSMNCYESRIRSVEMARIHELLRRPILVGEWHFGALDAGLPATGIGAVRGQEARGQAFRIYTEDAAAKPWCIGVHYFTLYDQSALGRFDGENYNIGFMDVCNRPYEPLATAARISHERLYPLALGQVQPFQDAPEYLPKLFL